MKNFIEKTMDRAAERTACAALALRKNAADFMKNEEGETNLVAILLIIVVTVALVAIFKDRITDLVNGIFDKIGKEVAKI
ncbi:MAG: Flp1 family type IVb pilin [Oscillospiraceae bacterium]|nr:hypothetical protein [Oscillospiraceae bacterium]MDD6081798.1 Flp1 family type IVb pilin [Oscillospiraceae bacterium]